MSDDAESSVSNEYFDSGQARRTRKTLGEAAAHKIVNSVYLEVLPQLESVVAKLKAEGVREMMSDSMLYDAFKYACDDIADVNIHDVSSQDIADQARRALQVGLARAIPGTVVQFPGMRGDSFPIITAKELMARDDLPDVGFLVDNMIPFGKITGLGGEDGTGKSRLMLQLAVGACSTGVWPGLGIPVATGPVIFYTVEETPRDMRSRLIKLAKALDIDVSLENLHIIAMGAEETAVLGAEDKGQVRKTKLFGKFAREIDRIKPVLIEVDPLAEVFDGDEIKRNLVKKFVGLFRPLIADRRTALVMSYHPSLTGLANRTGSSGSTGWRAAYRGNIWIEKDVDDDPTVDTGNRTLHVMKVTEGTPNQKINLRFAEGGVLVLADQPGIGGATSAIDGVAAIARAEREFLDFVAERTRQGRPVSPNKKAGNYAPKELVSEEGGRDRRTRVAAVERTMEALFKGDQLKSVSDGPASKGKLKLVVTSDNRNHTASCS
jgi:archaellum biogenesis ATPase FlaH